MTTIDIIAMALKAGFKEHNGMIYVTTINDDCAKELERFAELVRANEREACAKVCEELHPGLSSKRVAEIIREKRNQMICDECETVAHCMKNGCVTKQPEHEGAIEVSVIFHKGQRMFAVPKQPARLDLPDFIAGALGVSRGTAYDMMREALKEKNCD